MGGGGGRQVDLSTANRHSIAVLALQGMIHVLQKGTDPEKDQVAHAVLNCLVARQNTDSKPKHASAWGCGFGSDLRYYSWPTAAANKKGVKAESGESEAAAKKNAAKTE